jgi:copper homeostasis protein
MLEEARARLTISIVAMVRPREGGPCPPEPDFRAAVRDVECCVRHGADEIICGVLDGSGRVDRSKNKELLEAAGGKPVAFHRVFDMTPDLDESLESLVELGFCRVLTSGGFETVDGGMAVLERLVRRAAGRITILPGGGVRPSNARALVEAGCTELHFSFREPTLEAGYGGVADFRPLPERIAAVRSATA